jgi:hypothetical protein
VLPLPACVTYQLLFETELICWQPCIKAHAKQTNFLLSEEERENSQIKAKLTDLLAAEQSGHYSSTILCTFGWQNVVKLAVLYPELSKLWHTVFVG